jgi:hypothetical protein
MRRRLSPRAGLALSLAGSLAGLGAACATAGPTPDPRGAPLYTRSWSPYSPEELNRDVVECADQTRTAVSRESWILEATRTQLRGTFEARTTACMEQRGWTRVSAR